MMHRLIIAVNQLFSKNSFSNNSLMSLRGIIKIEYSDICILINLFKEAGEMKGLGIIGTIIVVLVILWLLKII